MSGNKQQQQRIDYAQREEEEEDQKGKEGESKVEDGEMKLLHNMDSHTSGMETAAAAALCDKLRIPHLVYSVLRRLASNATCYMDYYSICRPWLSHS